jgi:hypothetical protein
MSHDKFTDKAVELAVYYYNRGCEQDEIIELFCMDAVIEPERIRAEERERCASFVEQMTSRKRTIYGAINGEPVADCPIAAAIRGL